MLPLFGGWWSWTCLQRAVRVRLGARFFFFHPLSLLPQTALIIVAFEAALENENEEKAEVIASSRGKLAATTCKLLYI